MCGMAENKEIRFVHDPVDQGGPVGSCSILHVPEELVRPCFAVYGLWLLPPHPSHAVHAASAPPMFVVKCRRVGWHRSVCTNQLASMWPIVYWQGLLFHLSRTKWLSCLRLHDRPVSSALLRWLS